MKTEEQIKEEIKKMDKHNSATISLDDDSDDILARICYLAQKNTLEWVLKDGN